jgi:hypothetical protein
MKMNYANHFGYTDVNPFEVVRVISDKTIEVREMKAELDPSYKPEFIPGGFSVHCTNNGNQKWIITSDEAAPVIRLRLSKNHGWQAADGRKFGLSDTPTKHYDYNF